LTVINDQGQQVASVAAPMKLGRDYNEALVHQVVTAFRRMRAAVTVRSRRVPK